MPELPEVETTIRGITPSVLNAKISDVVIRCSQLRWPIPSDLREQIGSQSIIHISRRGKYILMQCQRGTLMIHLGMSGRLRLLTHAIPPQKHDHADFIFESCLLRFTDPRRFGAILWTAQDPLTHPLLKSLGVEPLEEAFQADYLYNRIKHRKSAIKSLIMNHHIVVGVGNIYASEALFLAKIHPKRNAASLSWQDCSLLVNTIKQVLEAAITAGGSTLKDFFNSDGKPGYFTQYLHVYGRANQPCDICSQPLQSCIINQRNTFFCDQCQH